MAYKKFDSNAANVVLALYKKANNEELLYDLYTTIEHMIDTVTKNRAKTFSKKHPEDFADILQDTKLSIFKILPKVASWSIDGEQFVCILVSAINYAFRGAYRKYKMTTAVKPQGSSFNNCSWQPDADVFIEFPLSLDSACVEQQTLLSRYPEVFIKEPKIEDGIYLKQFYSNMREKVLALNRYKDKADVVNFCFTAVLEGRKPSKSLIKQYLKTASASFWIDYTTLLLRIAMVQAYEKHNSA